MRQPSRSFGCRSHLIKYSAASPAVRNIFSTDPATTPKCTGSEVWARYTKHLGDRCSTTPPSETASPGLAGFQGRGNQRCSEMASAIAARSSARRMGGCGQIPFEIRSGMLICPPPARNLSVSRSIESRIRDGHRNKMNRSVRHPAGRRLGWPKFEFQANCPLIGSSRMRLPVAAKTALQIAGAMGGTPGSPTPAGAASLATTCTWVSTGAWLMRATG